MARLPAPRLLRRRIFRSLPHATGRRAGFDSPRLDRRFGHCGMHRSSSLKPGIVTLPAGGESLNLLRLPVGRPDQGQSGEAALAFLLSLSTAPGLAAGSL